MRENTEKARSAAATVERATETGTTCKTTSTSETNSTMPAAWWPQISDFLMHGAENAVPLRHLKAVTGMEGRTIRRKIESERRRGIPILSDNLNGYFLPASEGERERFVKSMRHRAGEILKSAAAIERGG